MLRLESVARLDNTVTDKMKIHESINTVIAVLGFAIASITAWNQFGPDPDEIDIEIGGPVVTDFPFQRVSGFYDAERELEKDIAGPVLWKLTAYNSLDRPVTIKKVETLMLSEMGGSISYSGLEIGTFGRKIKSLEFPLTIQARSAQVIIVGLNIPVNTDLPNEINCYDNGRPLQEVEICRYQKGYDLFGNAVNYKEFKNPSGKNGFNVSWVEGNDSPQFITTVTTGDNSKFNYRLQFYPWTK